MRSVRPQDQTNARVGRAYVLWYDGDGARTEFALPKSLIRADDLTVWVQGLVQRPADASGTYDYEVRGVRASYPGDKNMVRFAVAPAAGVHVGFHINGD